MPRTSPQNSANSEGNTMNLFQGLGNDYVPLIYSVGVLGVVVSKKERLSCYTKEQLSP